MQRVRPSIAIGASSLVLVLTGALMLAFGGDALPGKLSAAQAAVLQFVQMHPGLAAGFYVAFVASGTLTPFPSAIVVMLLGGYLFGAVAGGILSAAGATLSAAAIHLLGRAIFSRWVTTLLAARFAAAEEAMRSNALRYLLAIRLLPGMPAWIANLIPVPFPVPLSTLLLATFLGILPICMITANVGSSLASLEEINSRSAHELLLRPDLLVPLIALFLLAVLPIAARRWRPVWSGAGSKGGTVRPLDSEHGRNEGAD